MKHKILIYVLVLFTLCISIMLIYEKMKMNDSLQAAQRLYDIDQQMISLDIEAYYTLQHCYDQPTTCNIFNPGGKADQFAKESAKLTKEKQSIIRQYPLLVPKQDRTVWEIQ